MCKLMKLYIMTLSHTNCHAIKLIDKPDIPTILVNVILIESLYGTYTWRTIRLQVNEN